ncbi:DUF2786 domain-containing protein [Rhodococcoides yunnanense]|uniref:DUF2786 domain-containing protein n=1 Tax=Rhodococcoides yunnanense TaxID=278209 RepID=UPI00093370D4|nr:DUF2786 domain-containing protein [Rhodococcus yunnanensis]
MDVHDRTRAAGMARTQHHGIDIETLMASGVQLAADPLTTHSALSAFVGRMIQLESRMTSVRLTTECSAYAVDVLATVFERGWQPVELVHVLERLADKSTAQMSVSLIAEHSRRTRALSTAPEAWKGQLHSLGADPGAGLTRFRATSGLDPRSFWTGLLRLLVRLRRMHTVVTVGPPPSKWGDSSTTAGARTGDIKLLDKIRGLLAKAESSTFPAESESFSAKAQELMTQYSIDAALLLDREAGGPTDSVVITRRLTVSNPYVDAKMKLLSAVASANGVRTVRYRKLGLIAMVGMPVDLDLCELLYTSLLVQSAQDLERVGIDSTMRGRGFRRSFLYGYAGRIGERLVEARERAQRRAAERYGSSLVPLFEQRDRAVASTVEDLFPDLATIRTSMSNTSGWSYGRRAADTADITGGREQIDDSGDSDDSEQ